MLNSVLTPDPEEELDALDARKRSATDKDRRNEINTISNT